MRISDWSSDVCSSDLGQSVAGLEAPGGDGVADAFRYAVAQGCRDLLDSEHSIRIRHDSVRRSLLVQTAGRHAADPVTNFHRRARRYGWKPPRKHAGPKSYDMPRV